MGTPGTCPAPSSREPQITLHLLPSLMPSAGNVPAASTVGALQGTPQTCALLPGRTTWLCLN